MMAANIIVIAMILGGVFVLGRLFCDYATNTLSEKRFMLTSAKDRRQIILNSPNISEDERQEQLAKSDQEITLLENQLQNFWAKRFARETGIFDYL